MSLRPSDRVARSRGRALALWWLLLCLAVVPSLGKLHQVAHARLAGPPALHQHTHVHTHASTHQHDAQAHGDDGDADHGAATLAGGILPDHAPADCLLLDQLALGDALAMGALPQPVAVPLATLAIVCATSHAAQISAPFEARAPPRG